MGNTHEVYYNIIHVNKFIIHYIYIYYTIVLNCIAKYSGMVASCNYICIQVNKWSPGGVGQVKVEVDFQCVSMRFKLLSFDFHCFQNWPLGKTVQVEE